MDAHLPLGHPLSDGERLQAHHVRAAHRDAVPLLLAKAARPRERAYLGVKSAAVTFVQRFGGALNLNVHLHVLLPDGVFVLEEKERFRVVPLPPPEDEDIARLVQKIARRVIVFYENHFATLEDRGDDVLESAIHEAMQRVPKLVVPDESQDDESLDLESTTAKTFKALRLGLGLLNPRQYRRVLGKSSRPGAPLSLWNATRLLARAIEPD